MKTQTTAPQGGLRRSPFRPATWIATALVLTACLAEGASAGVIDTALPILQAGKKTKQVFTTTGVLNTAVLATLIQCTSLEPVSTIPVAVEFFGKTGGPPLNDVTTGSGNLLVGVGQTIIMSTQAVTSEIVDQNVNIGVPQQGSARILSTSTKLTCTAWVQSANPGAAPPAMNILPLLKGKTPRGF